MLPVTSNLHKEIVVLPLNIIYINLNYMAKQIKLIWDFRGPAAEKTAEHHEIHLKEFISAEKLDLNITGYTVITDMHSIAYLVVNEKEMIAVRDALKPHRGELYTTK